MGCAYTEEMVTTLYILVKVTCGVVCGFVCKGRGGGGGGGTSRKRSLRIGGRRLSGGSIRCLWVMGYGWFFVCC
jgi:hypothetical protein